MSGAIRSHFQLAVELSARAAETFRNSAFSIHYSFCSSVLFCTQQLVLLYYRSTPGSGPNSQTFFPKLPSAKNRLFASRSRPGYRIRLGSSTDKKDTGRLHVDYAQARDDLYEWECKQRMLAREERHRRRIEEDRLRPPSPPPIVHYSEHECSQLGEKIKGEAGPLDH